MLDPSGPDPTAPTAQAQPTTDLTQGAVEEQAGDTIVATADQALDAVLAEDGPAGADGSPTPATAPRRRRRRRKPVKRATIVAHRWTSFVLGILLLVITTSGAIVVFTPEWQRWTSGSVFTVTHSEHPIGIPEAIDVVATAFPDFEAGSANVYHGLIEVGSVDDDAHPGFWGVDPGSGRITGYSNPDAGFMAFMNQVHECFFTCDDYPGYVPFLNDHVPTLGMTWLKDMTWSTFILGSFGVFLLFLGISGIWLWWPGIRTWRHGFRLRRDKGRYARDYDLHQVIGMAAIPFLLMWGLTGASFEFHWVKTAWYAVTGGQQDHYEPFASTAVTDKATPDISLATALAAAQAKAGPDATPVYVSSPAKDDPTAAYSFYFSRHFDQYRFGAYPGQYGVDVDRHDATHLHAVDYGTAPTVSNQLIDNYAAPLFHYGQSVNVWWRVIWFVFGFTPLALAATGISTWLAKRSVRKRRKAATAAAAPAPA